MTSNDPLPTRKRTYSELEMKGPPLCAQGIEIDLARRSSASSLSLDASRTALLVVDVQPEYWSECPAVRQDFPQFPTQMARLVNEFRHQSAECIWVRADYDYDKSPWLQQFTRIHKGKIPPIVKPSSKWESFAEPVQDEVVLTKSSWSSTSNTELLDILRERGIETVLVCGLITSVCVQHSAFGLFEAGFRTMLVTDCCADRGLERHKAALALYGGYMYELCDVESVRRGFDEYGKLVHSSGQSTSTGSLTTMSSYEESAIEF